MRRQEDILANDSEIGDWFLIELFQRLPLKSLLKFKCVSKRWFSLTPSYTLLHRKAEMFDSQPNPWIKIKTHSKFKPINTPPPFLPEAPRAVRLVATHNDHLLSRDLSSKKPEAAYYVSKTNPFTIHSQCVALPHPPRHRPWGIGFIVRSDSTYNVVTIHYLDQELKLGLDLFDSGSGQWRSSSVALSHPVGEISGYSHASLKSEVLLYRGALHWLFRPPRVQDGCFKIVAFDPAMHELEGDDYKCRVFDCTPALYHRHHQDLSIFGESGGELRYAEHMYPYVSRFLRIWLLKDYDSVSPQWVLEHEIGYSDLSTSILLARGDYGDSRICCVCSLLSFNPFDKDMIYFGLHLAEPNWLVSYSISTGTSKILRCESDFPISTYVVNPETLVLPCLLPPCSWPTKGLN